MDIMNRHSFKSFNDARSGIFCDCPFLLGHLENTMLECDDTEGLKSIQIYKDEIEKQRALSVQNLIDEEAEEALRLAASKPKPVKRSGKGKKGKGKGGKGKGKKTVKKVKPVSKPAAPQDFSLPTAPKIVRADPDRREVTFAKIVIGEYIMEAILKPALTFLGFEDGSYSWDQVVEAINSNVTGQLSARRVFLFKCVEWIKERNLVAHPTFEYEEDHGQLWFDLDAIESQLETSTVAFIRRLLKDKHIQRPKTQSSFSPFGRPELGITEVAMKRTFAAVRLSEFVMSRTVNGPCTRHRQKPALPVLKGWRVYLPFLGTEAKLTDEDMDAVIDLLQLRNGLAHPDVTSQMVRVLVENVLGQHPDYELFLSHLGKKD
jgi:hypothetical protein